VKHNTLPTENLTDQRVVYTIHMSCVRAASLVEPLHKQYGDTWKARVHPSFVCEVA